ncbi:thiamine-triphosphatase isoform X3 [Lepeophtheirus salmonis]|uniref:Thiamine-triphosphatase n=2 Tax=Lepeophtheirus salmonis TaxID=72036 RepID=A0A0K2U3K6_LEPSM|nr:thiamine-triphosphatase-like isoform X3 [Lepeophtheirus salmonis]
MELIMNTRAIYWKGNAKDVKISGTFTNWKSKDMKNISGTDSWISPVPFLSEDEEHEYKFLVDGNWIHDPDKPTKPNSLGTLNNVIERKTPSEVSMIEVERKFNVPDCYESLMERHGFKNMMGFERDEELCDIYYDSDRYDLMKEDYWLRWRNGDWELKYPVGVHPTGSTLYHETSNVRDIVSKLQILIPQKNNQSVRNSTIFNNIGDFICNQILHKFAELKTKRRHYQKDNVNIVVDETNWGYKVGEIEMVVKEKSEVPEASKKIDSIARQLNFKKLNLTFAASKITSPIEN